MGKNKEISQITNILSTALRHKIGAILGRDKDYFKKYQLEFTARKEKAERILKNCNFNDYDKNIVKIKIKEKLSKELKSRAYISEEKFKIMDEEINKILKELALS